MEQLGGIATLPQLYKLVLTDPEFEHATRTPRETIRRIVRTRPEIVPLRIGVYGLRSHETEFPPELAATGVPRKIRADYDHYLIQGKLIEVGKNLGYKTCIPAQDVNRPFLKKTLGEIADMNKPYEFGYSEIVKRAATVDVIWFNARKMPTAFVEVEHSTDFQNSLGKFTDLQDFFSQFYLVAEADKQELFMKKIKIAAYADIRERVGFISYKKASDWHEKSVVISDLKSHGLR